MKLTYALAVTAALLGGATASHRAVAGEDCGGCCADKAKTAIGQISTEELAKLVSERQVAEKKAYVFDVNSADRFAEGHIPGATHTAKDKLAGLPADKAAKLVFYCGSEKCGASTAAAKKAVELGCTNVFVYKPGIAGWEQAKQPVEKAAPATGTPS